MIALFHYPDAYKGFLKGVIKALNLSMLAAVINLTGHWLINVTLQLTLAFYFEMGILGIWIGKATLEFYIYLTYNYLVSVTDWDEKAVESQQMAEKEKIIQLQNSDDFIEM